MYKQILNRLTYIASCILSEKARNFFLLFLASIATILFAFFSYFYFSYYETIDVYRTIGLDEKVYWIMPISYDYADAMAVSDVVSELEEVESVNITLASVADLAIINSNDVFIFQDYSFLGRDFPLNIKEGRLPECENEVVISETAAKSYSVGDIINCSMLYGIGVSNGQIEYVNRVESELIIVGIAYNDSFIMKGGYSTDEQSDLVGFFQTIEDEEQSWSPIIPYMFVNGVNGANSELFSKTAFIVPADGYTQEDVVQALVLSGVEGKFESYKEMKDGYDGYYSQIKRTAYIVGAIVVILIFTMIVTGVVLGLESNKRKLQICCICGAKEKSLMALSVFSYIPAVFTGNIIGLTVGNMIINRIYSPAYSISVIWIISVFVIELLIFGIVLLPYVLRKELIING